MDKQTLARLSRQFATMIDAGLPLVQMLKSLGTMYKHDDPELAAMLLEIEKAVKEGTMFSDALREHPNVFNELFCNLVACGEQVKILDTILNRLAGHLEKQLRFESYLEQLMGKDILAGIRQLLEVFRHKMGGEAFGAAVLNAPGIGPLMLKIEVARFTRTLAIVISSGVPILDAMDFAANACENPLIKKAILAAKKAMTGKRTTRKQKKGGRTTRYRYTSMAKSLAKSKVFPRVMIQMIAVGEQTGALDTMLSKIADFYEDEVDAAFRGLLRTY